MGRRWCGNCSTPHGRGPIHDTNEASMPVRVRFLTVRFCGLLMVALPLIMTAVMASAQGRRVALIVGNSQYKAVPQLTNPANDARLMAKTLDGLGFELVGGGAQVDLDKAKFEAAVHDFGIALPGAEVALFYYAGHGLQVQGANWLVPLDANPTRPQDLDFQMIDASLVLKQMEGAGTKLNVMILDACRNNPFGGRGLRGTQSGLAQMQAPEGTLISYATQPGNTASDGAGADSPYTVALTDAMKQPGLDVLRMFNRIGVTVKRATGGQQQPWLSSSPIDGDYYFAGPGSVPAIATTPAMNSPPVLVPERPKSVPAVSVNNMIGSWRFADGASCSQAHMGVVDVRGEFLYFEWRRAAGPSNIAVEHIERTEGDVIFTVVQSDKNTSAPETGQRVRYVIQHDSWTSTNLATGRSYTHSRC
jgi:hypothetical protein